MTNRFCVLVGSAIKTVTGQFEEANSSEIAAWPGDRAACGNLRSGEMVKVKVVTHVRYSMDKLYNNHNLTKKNQKQDHNKMILA